MLLWFKPFLFLFFEERFAHPIAKPPVAMWKLFALLLAFVSVALGAGAFGSLWLVDLRGVMGTMWPGYDLFTTEFADYVFNLFAMISSDSSQHWFAVHGLYVDEPDAIAGVSDVYGAFVYGYWTLVFIGFFSFLLLMAKLLPMFADRHLPWHEAIIQSNDYPGEIGCSVTVRSYMQPLVWWLRVGAEVSISAGTLMFQNFKAIKLPRLIIMNEWNYAAWKPFLQNECPLYFAYTPHKSLGYKETILKMFVEESYMAETNPIHAISKSMMKRLCRRYVWPYEQGRFLDKDEKRCLDCMRRGFL